MPPKRPNHPFDEISQALGRMAEQLSGTHFAGFRPPSQGWRPNLNAYRCADSVEICVDLAGVDKSAIALSVHGRLLHLRGQREAPTPPHDAAHACRRIVTMEIENGPFERSLELPDEVDTDGITARQENGLLWIHLPLKH